MSGGIVQSGYLSALVRAVRPLRRMPQSCRSDWAMTFLKRLRVLPALLGVAATLAAVGTSIFGDLRARPAPPAATPALDVRPDGARVTDELAANRFAKLPVLTYQPREGELLFAWQ